MSDTILSTDDGVDGVEVELHASSEPGVNQTQFSALAMSEP